jgi:flagella basal body P-ring formation protein FlgA
MKLHALALLLLPLAPFAAQAGASGDADVDIRIELRSPVLVGTGQVRLGDIAVIHTQDLPTIQRLVALPLGAAPPQGSESVVERETIARWVRRRLGLRPDAVAWAGAFDVFIRGTMPQIAAARTDGSGPLVARGEWVSLRL